MKTDRLIQPTQSNKGIGWLLILLMVVLVVLSITWHLVDYYGIISFFVIGLFLFERWLRFEKTSMDTKALVLLAILSALAVLGRVPFAGLPSVQATSAIIMLTAVVFGPSMGFMVGATAALVSNLVLGQGPWTPWQMLAWGGMGFITGLIYLKSQQPKVLGLMGLGLVFGLLYGWVMNIWTVLGYLSPITLEGVLILYISSFYLDLIHGISNAVLIFVLLSPFSRILKRIQINYQIRF